MNFVVSYLTHIVIFLLFSLIVLNQPFLIVLIAIIITELIYRTYKKRMFKKYKILLKKMYRLNCIFLGVATVAIVINFIDTSNDISFNSIFSLEQNIFSFTFLKIISIVHLTLISALLLGFRIDISFHTETKKYKKEYNKLCSEKIYGKKLFNKVKKLKKKYRNKEFIKEIYLMKRR